MAPSTDLPPSKKPPVFSSVLDDAYEHMAASGFEDERGFVNHGPMACEALCALEHDEAIGPWAHHYAQVRGPRAPFPHPNHLAERDALDALGTFALLPDWIGFFLERINIDGWQGVIDSWLPRLVPGLATALFHGTIRTAHALRALAQTTTSIRRAELARSLGYWAARWQVNGTDIEIQGNDRETADPRAAVLQAAQRAAVLFVDVPDIFRLHGVTAAMATTILLTHLSPSDQLLASARLLTEHVALFGPDYTRADSVPREAGHRLPSRKTRWDDRVVEAAVASFDAHQIKLVEACRRGFAATAEPIFLSAAAEVVGINERHSHN